MRNLITQNSGRSGARITASIALLAIGFVVGMSMCSSDPAPLVVQQRDVAQSQPLPSCSLKTQVGQPKEVWKSKYSRPNVKLADGNDLGPCNSVPRLPSNCMQEDEWLRLWSNRRGPSSSKHHWVIADVGANKGYAIVSLLEALGVKLPFGRSDVFKKAKQYAADFAPEMQNASRGIFCGACSDCDSKLRGEVKFPATSYEFHAFEGMSANADFLKTSILPQLTNVTLHQGAVSDRVGTAQFPVLGFGQEVAKIGGRGKKEQVPQMTLNDRLRHLDYIDVLLTDTEGFDMWVADGATDFLLRDRVGLYVFEIHRNPIKPSRTLLGHFERLERAGFNCFYPLRGMLPYQLAQARSECWAPRYAEMFGWGNAVCVHSKEQELLELMKELLVTPRTNVNGKTDPDDVITKDNPENK